LRTAERGRRVLSLWEDLIVVGRRLLVITVILLAGFHAVAGRAEVLIGVAGPMTGKNAWFGEELQRGAELAVADLDAAGGVLGQQVRLISADDFCDPEQAVAAARKLVSDGAIFVVGHYCSHSSIPASEIYQAAGVLMISPASSNPMLTELGRTNIFRVQTRDDAVGVVAGNYLADHWPAKKIAILHDNTIFGKGVADLTKKQLNRRGLTEAIYQAYVPGKADYGVEIAGLQAADIAVAFIGGYHTEIALMARAAGDHGYRLQLIAGLTLATEEFGLIGGPAAEGTLFVDNPDPRIRPEAESVVQRFRASGFEPEGNTLLAYGAVQVWAQAVAAAGSLDLGAVLAAMHSRQFATVLGPIGFDEKGDVTLQSPVVYVWHANGTHMLEQGMAKE
jgi:branched-chain amino acid transport system substrate-binding protein